MNIDQISASLTHFELLVYPGDVLSFLNTLIHELEGIQRIATATGRIKMGNKISILIEEIESPTILRKSS